MIDNSDAKENDSIYEIGVLKLKLYFLDMKNLKDLVIGCKTFV